MNKIRLLAAALLVCIVFSVYAVEKEGSRMVFIVTQKSKFKKKLLVAINERLEKEELLIKVINLKDLSNMSDEDYAALLFIGSSQPNHQSKKMNKYISDLNVEERKKIVLYETSGNGQWRTSLTGVDAVTSASDMNKMSDVVDEILDKIKVKI